MSSQLPTNTPLDQVQETEMSFFDHLEELRWHIIRSLGAIAVFAFISFLAKGFIFDTIIFGPKNESFLTYQGFCSISHAIGLGDLMCLKPAQFTVANLEMAGQFLAHIKVSLIIGLIFGFPYAFWEIWRFIKPGLYDSEVRYTRGIVFFTSVLFSIGVIFGYFILSPFSINFFATYSISTEVNNVIALSSYMAIITTIVLATGIMFELPMVVYFLAKIGIITPEDMRLYRRHALIVILVISAIITPADVWTQVLIAVPVYFLYEFSILICRRVVKQNRIDEANFDMEKPN